MDDTNIERLEATIRILKAMQVSGNATPQGLRVYAAMMAVNVSYIMRDLGSYDDYKAIHTAASDILYEAHANIKNENNN